MWWRQLKIKSWLNVSLLWSVVENDDSPMQVETISDPMATQITLKGLDRHSHYRFFLRGRTAAGDGEPATKDGATTLEGGTKLLSSSSRFWHVANRLCKSKNFIPFSHCLTVPPDTISLSAGERSVNISWVAKKRHRNVGFQIHYFNKNGTVFLFVKTHAAFILKVHPMTHSLCRVFTDGSKWKKTEKVNSSQSFYQLQGLNPGSHYHLRFTYSNITFWETDVKTEETGTILSDLQSSFILCSFICSALSLSSGFPTSKYKAWSYRECLPVLSADCEGLSKTCVKREPYEMIHYLCLFGVLCYFLCLPSEMPPC